MGTFEGHIFPGTIFMAYGIWWTVQMYLRYFKSINNNTTFKSSVTYPCSSLCGKYRNYPLESLIKIAILGSWLPFELLQGVRLEILLENSQHATMFFFFILAGVVELLLYYGHPLPKDTDYVTNILAVGIEGLLFFFHIHGRSEVNQRVHLLLIFVILLNFVFLCIEMSCRTSLLAALCRSYSFILQGTWFWQTAFVLFNPSQNAAKWKENDQDELMLLVMIFTWHCGGVFLAILVIGQITRYFFNRKQKANGEEILRRKLIANNEKDLMSDDGDWKSYQ